MTSEDNFDDFPNAVVDYLEEARAAVESAHLNLSKLVAPSIDTLLLAGQVNALLSIAESLESISLLFDDDVTVHLYPADND